MGLRAVTDHGPTAHVVAVLSAQELRLQMADSNVVGCPPTLSRGLLDKLNEMTGREDTEQSLEGATQREVNLAVDRKDHEDLSILIEESGSIRDEARLGSLGLPNAGSWLNVIPSPALVHLKPYFHSLSQKGKQTPNTVGTKGKFP